jgi:hypothetical protein
VVVGVDPVLRHEAHLAGTHRFDGLLRDRLAVGVGLGHRHEPLVGQHRFDHGAGAGAARHHQLVLLRLDQEAQCFEIGHHCLAGDEAIEAAVLLGRVVVDRGIERQHAQARQSVALADRVVVRVVGRRHLDHAGAEFAIDIVVGNHRDQPVGQRQLHLAADQRTVAFVLGMDHHGGVAQHGFRPRGRDRQRSGAVGQRIGDMPEKSLFLFAFDLEVAHRGLQHGVPVDQPLAAIDQPLFVELDESLRDDVRQVIVHGEVFAAPVHRVAHAAHLLGDRVAGLLLPVPDAGDEILAAEVVAAGLLLLQLALHHDLGGDPRVVRARHPQRVVARHPVVARQAVHDRLVEGMPHVQRARDVGRRQLDGERGGILPGLARAAEPCRGIAAPLPLGAPVRLDGHRFEGFGQAVEAGLEQGIAHGVAKTSGIPQDAACGV